MFTHTSHSGKCYRIISLKCVYVQSKLHKLPFQLIFDVSFLSFCWYFRRRFENFSFSWRGIQGLWPLLGSLTRSLVKLVSPPGGQSHMSPGVNGCLGSDVSAAYYTVDKGRGVRALQDVTIVQMGIMALSPRRLSRCCTPLCVQKVKNLKRVFEPEVEIFPSFTPRRRALEWTWLSVSEEDRSERSESP